MFSNSDVSRSNVIKLFVINYNLAFKVDYRRIKAKFIWNRKLQLTKLFKAQLPKPSISLFCEQ